MAARDKLYGSQADRSNLVDWIRNNKSRMPRKVKKQIDRQLYPYFPDSDWEDKNSIIIANLRGQAGKYIMNNKDPFILYLLEKNQIST